MIGRLYNKMRKEMRNTEERRAQVRPFDISLVDKKLRHLWNNDDPINDTRVIKCECGNRKRFHIPAYAKGIAFRCSKCRKRVVLDI
ncbi:MAG: hypothetical protein KF748_01205 [Xanthobacteraceae bacterium]|nr:hypothetical protein [Xanthobacteraceae bacterium]